MVEVAKHEVIARPLRAINEFSPFLGALMTSMHYKELIATPANIIYMPATVQEVVFGYVIRMIGSMKQNQFHNFLRFVTGSSIPIDESIAITFNSPSFFFFSRRHIVVDSGSFYLSYIV